MNKFLLVLSSLCAAATSLPAQTAVDSFAVAKGVSTVAPFAFSSCSRIKTISLGDDVETLGDYAFFNETGSVMQNCTLYVPAGKAEYYGQKKGFYIVIGEGDEAEDYPFFASVVEMPAATDISNLAVKRPTGTKRFNLAGQQVGASYKGIVIENGMKRFER
ncbi:MAG: hypothetical protein PUG09_07355 [Prevotella sp.]|nr:hypothetical protein [Prevotella sp.]